MSIHAETRQDGTATVTIDGQHVHQIQASDLTTVRAHVTEYAAQIAAHRNQVEVLTTSDPEGEFALLVHPNGALEEAPARPAAPLPPASSPLEPAAEAPVVTEEEQPSRRERRETFLRTEHREEPATSGWRGALASAGFRIGPGEAERRRRADIRAVSQHWPGPRTIAVVNAKGGAGKTPTTILLSAVFARHGGAGVLAWDNNQTRGTLGWRTEQGPHEATLLELLPQVDTLLGAGAQSADLARFVHHQTADRYDVLRSKPTVLASEQRISAADVRALHAVAAKYYRLIIIDSGNDETDPLWLQMIDQADQLVLATTTRADHAEAGALLLEGLAARDAHSAKLAQKAVVVVSQADPRAAADVRRIAENYRRFTRDAVTIPFDPALVDGPITHDALRTDTQRAWLAAAAAVSQGL